jgi:hypothetical protein
MGAVMCAMTKVNGTLPCENSELIQSLLKTELGFPGLVFSDVNGQSTAFGSANGGLDFGSSSIWSNATLTFGLNNGSFTQARLDDMAVRDVIGYYIVTWTTVPSQLMSQVVHMSMFGVTTVRLSEQMVLLLSFFSRIQIMHFPSTGRFP